MKKRIIQFLVAAPAFTFLIFCSREKNPVSQSYERHIDTTITVYGAYTPILLPVTKGIKITNPIQVGLGPGGFIYASNQSGEVYSLRDTDGDGLEDTALLYCNVTNYGLSSPSSFTFKGNQLYVGTSQQIRVFEDLDADGTADSSWVFFKDFPNSKHPYEWTTGLNFGPDGYLYFALSSDSWNVAPSPDKRGFRGALLRVSPDGKHVERLATGLRSPYGLAFNRRGDLFFIDNEGGENPSEELNRWIEDAFYGHNKKKFPEYDSVTAPEHALTSDVAPAGIEFNSSENDFGGTSGNLFIAFYGPGERWERGSIARVKITYDSISNRYAYEESPVADIPKLADLAFGQDGSLYAAQNGKASYWYEPIPEESNQGRFYKLIYDADVKPAPVSKRMHEDASKFSKTSIELGKQLYARRACQGCHETDGQTELLGPNLKYVGNRLTRKEILESIKDPSKIIKPSMMALRVNKKDGQTLVGRVVSSNSEMISLMLMGNIVIDIPRSEIHEVQNEPKSLMPEGLLKPLKKHEIDALLYYVISLKNNNNKF